MTNQQHPGFPSLLRRVALAALVLAGPLAFAAEAASDRVVVKLSDPSRPATVRAHILNGSITVKGYDGNEVIVEAHGRAHEGHEESEPPENARGMHRIPQTATGLSVDSDNNDVRIKVDAISRTVDLVVTVPRHTSVSLHSVNSGNITVSDVEGELDINNVNGGVTLNHVAGSAVAHALNGRVLATFNRIDPQKPLAFSSMNGDIDVTLPSDVKANLSLRTDNGEIYSDFDIQLQSSEPRQTVEDNHEKGGKYRVRIDKTLHATLNGGGPEIQIKNFNGNIYLRKAGK